jgi:hypothetical protein
MTGLNQVNFIYDPVLQTFANTVVLLSCINLLSVELFQSFQVVKGPVHAIDNLHSRVPAI